MLIVRPKGARINIRRFAHFEAVKFWKGRETILRCTENTLEIREIDKVDIAVGIDPKTKRT